MINIIIGNIIALIASLLMVFSGLEKKKEKIIYIQTIQIGLAAISNIVLGGLTGAVINGLSCIRNILCYKNMLKIKEKILIVGLSILLSLIFNDIGLIEIILLISTIIYTFLMNMKDVVKFKKLIILTMIVWFIYDLSIKSYSSAVFNFMNIITNSFSIYKLKYSKTQNRVLQR